MTDENPATETLRTEMPSSVSDAMSKGMARASDAHEKLTAIAQNSAEAFNEACSCANRGSVELRGALLKAARQNSETAFDLARDILAAKSPTDLLSLVAEHQRKMFEMLAAQAKELSELGQKVATETAEPIRHSVTAPFRIAS